ncbi:MAG: hypothetical protein QG671_3768 [Actinomycetota bacterium]|nr:hypothetical protein [Actinomycetota bacterium]
MSDVPGTAQPYLPGPSDDDGTDMEQTDSGVTLSDAPKDPAAPRWAWGQERPSVMAGPTVPTGDLFRPGGEEQTGNFRPDAVDLTGAPTTSAPAYGATPTPNLFTGPAQAGQPQPAAQFPTTAIPAVQPSRSTAIGQPTGAGPPPGRGPIRPPGTAAVEVPTVGGAFPAASTAGQAQPGHGASARPPSPHGGAAPHDQGRFGTWSVFFLILAATTLAGLADEFLFGASTWLTGAVFVAASILAALLVRRRDMVTAVISPPLAFVVALLITAQADALRGGGNLFVKEASALVTGLAFNAPWVFGGTLAALVIIAARRIRLRSRDRASHAGR